MRWINLYESYNEEVLDLIEDVYTEVFDKWSIKRIPRSSVASDFMASVHDDTLYYHIDFLPDPILIIYQNRVHGSYSDFQVLVSDCVVSMSRLERFDLDYDITFDSGIRQNPYDPGMILLFFSLKLNKK